MSKEKACKTEIKEGKGTFECKKCGRKTSKEKHLCKPEKKMKE